MEIDKKKIEEDLKIKERVFRIWANDSLQSMKNFLPGFDDCIEDRKIEVEKLLYEIEILNKEKEQQIEKIKLLQGEESKIIINISEFKKTSKYGKYELYLSLKKVTEQSNSQIDSICNFKLDFKERVSVRNEILLKWIENNDVKEIYTNMNIDKFIKQNKLNNLKVITDN